MAAAYAALLSVESPSPPISIDKHQVESLAEVLTSLQEFLQGYNSPFSDSEEADPLQLRIADAAYAAEDVIESLIKKLAMEITTQNMQQQRKPNVAASVGFSGSSSTGLNNDTMVGFEEVLFEIMDKLTAGGVDRQVIPIVGMAGIGNPNKNRC